MRFFQNKDLGFDKENLVSFIATGATGGFLYNNNASFKEELLQRAKTIEAYKKLPIKAKEKKEKPDETEFLQASELSIDRKVIE